MYRWLIIATLLSILGGAAYYYYNTTQKQLQQYAKNVATLEANQTKILEANEQALETIDVLQDDFIKIQENYTRLETEFQLIREQNEQLSERFENNDLGRLAASRPELVERIINNASDKAIRCFELLSGSPLTEDERNAENAREFNSECPWLWDNTIP